MTSRLVRAAMAAWVTAEGRDEERSIVAGAVLINNVVRDTHFPFGQAVLRNVRRWRRRPAG